MNCDFVKTLTPEQKAELRKLLNEDEQSENEYRLFVEYWDPALGDGSKRKGIKLLQEFAGNRLHGVSKEWYSTGKPKSEKMYEKGLLHGTHKTWHPNGQLCQKVKYYLGSRTSTERFDENGNKVE